MEAIEQNPIVCALLALRATCRRSVAARTHARADELVTDLGWLPVVAPIADWVAQYARQVRRRSSLVARRSSFTPAAQRYGIYPDRTLERTWTEKLLPHWYQNPYMTDSAITEVPGATPPATALPPVSPSRTSPQRCK